MAETYINSIKFSNLIGYRLVEGFYVNRSTYEIVLVYDEKKEVPLNLLNCDVDDFGYTHRNCSVCNKCKSIKNKVIKYLKSNNIEEIVEND